MTLIALQPRTLKPEVMLVKPEFTVEQVEWLAWMLTPRCCHTVGFHNPDHCSEQTSICEYQTSERWLALVKSLDIFDRMEPENVISKTNCGWCRSDREKQEREIRIRAWLDQRDEPMCEEHGNDVVISRGREGYVAFCRAEGCLHHKIIPKDVADSPGGTREERIAGLIRQWIARNGLKCPTHPDVDLMVSVRNEGSMLFCGTRLQDVSDVNLCSYQVPVPASAWAGEMGEMPDDW